jgi:cardiolipin synthase
MTIPNLLTLTRILLTPLLVWLLLDYRPGQALVVFFVAGITDGLDGLVARLCHQKTTLGAYLDPLADKLLLVSSFILLSHLQKVPTWLAVIAVSRDAIIMLGVITLMFHQVRVEINPSLLGKMTTLVQILTVLLTLARPYLAMPDWCYEFLFWSTALLCIITGFQYIMMGNRLWERQRGEAADQAP